MLIDFRDQEWDDMFQWGIIDLATSCELMGPIIWADDDSGAYCEHVLDDDGNVQFNAKGDDVLVQTVHAPILIFERDPRIQDMMKKHWNESAKVASLKGNTDG